MNTLVALLNIHPGEGRSAGLMLCHAFCMGLATTFFETAATALFLTSFDREIIPLAYIAAAVVSTLTGITYTWVRSRVSFWSLMSLTLGLLLLVSAGFRVGFVFSTGAWLGFGMFVWYRVLSILTDLQYWAVAARIYDIRQSKRLFGMIGTGEVLARLLGAFSVPVLVPHMGVTNLILLSGMALFLCVVLLQLLRRHAGRVEEEQGDGQPAARVVSKPRVKSSGIRHLLGNRYLVSLCLLSALGIAGKLLVDFAFLQEVQARYSDAAQIAAFFGVFSGMTQLANGILRVFVSGRVLQRFGIRIGLLLLPAIHALCTVGFLAAIGLGGTAELGLVFLLAIANQGIYKTLKHPFDNPSMKVLYQPLSRELRLTTQIFNEVIVNPITIGLAGAAMLLFTALAGDASMLFAYILLATFGIWLAVAVWASKGYKRALVRAVSTSADDSSVPEVLEESSMDVSQSWQEMVCSSGVQLARAGTQLGEGQHQPTGDSGGGSQRAATCRELHQQGITSEAAVIRSLLGSPSPEIRRAALMGTLGCGDPRLAGYARDELAQVAVDPDAKQRLFAAQVLAESWRADYRPLLLGLLRDPDMGVRRAALAAAIGMEDPEVLSIALSCLAEPELARRARRVLGAAGGQAVAVLEQGVTRFEHDSTALLHVVRCLSKIRSSGATAVLGSWLHLADEAVRTVIFQELMVRGHRVVTAEHATIEALMRTEVALAVERLAALAILANTPVHRRLRAQIEKANGQSRHRLFCLASMVCDPEVVRWARKSYFSSSREQKAYAIELLDLHLPGPFKQWLLPLIEELPEAARLDKLERQLERHV